MLDNENPIAGDNSDLPEGQENPQAQSGKELAEMRERLDQLVSLISKQQAPKAPEAQKIDQEAINKMIAEDPNKAIAYLLKQAGQNATEAAIKSVQQITQKERYDQQMERDFAGLISDKEGLKEIQRQAAELVQEGEYTAESPKLMLRAAQLAANKFPHLKKTQVRDYDSGEPPSTFRGAKGRSSVPEGFSEMGRAFGFSEEKIKKLAEEKGFKR